MTGCEKTIIDADLCGKVARSSTGSIFRRMPGDRGDHGGWARRTFLEQRAHAIEFSFGVLPISISDNNSFEQWSAEGALDAAQRANKRWKQLLEEYVDPGLDPAIDEALQEFIARRKASMPDQHYF